MPFDDVYYLLSVLCAPPHTFCTHHSHTTAPTTAPPTFDLCTPKFPIYKMSPIGCTLNSALNEVY